MTVIRVCLPALCAGVALLFPCGQANAQATQPTTLYSFQNTAGSISDGASPIAGMLYDTSSNLDGGGSAGGAGNGRAFTVSGLSNTGTGTYSQGCNFGNNYGGFGTPMGDLVGAPSGSGILYYGAMSHLPDPNCNNNNGNCPVDYGAIISCTSNSQPPTLNATFTSTNILVDGGLPSGNIVETNTSGAGLKLYGTASMGGANDSCFPASASCTNTGGTIYVYSATSAALSAVHSFGGSSVNGPSGSQADGVEPVGGLTSNGQATPTLYGTTAFGGLYGYGTIFKCVVSNGSCSTYTILYNFGGSADGMTPSSPLVYVNGVLYGTTLSGGPQGGGTVFEFSAGSLTTLESFAAAGSTTDGANPTGDIVVNTAGSSPIIWGTTWQGGAIGVSTTTFGTIYRIQAPPSGTFTTEYQFQDGADGENPFGGLSYAVPGGSTGYVYGTTHGGGCGTGATGNGPCGTSNGVPGSGTIFSFPFN